MKPLVSFVMPTYNRAASILGSIQSILDQTETRWELIVVDDGSTDDTKAVVEAIGDERVRYVRQKNKGAPAARNTGVAKAHARWIAYLDSDNELFPEYLATMLDYLERNPAAVVAMPRAKRTLELWENGRLVKAIDDSDNTPPTLTIKEIFMMEKINPDTNGLIHLRRLFSLEGVRWDEALRHGMEDWDLVMTIGERHPDGFLYVPLVLYHYHQRYGGDGIVSNSKYQDWADTFEHIYQRHKHDKLLEGQTWYPRKVEKWTRLQQEYDAGKLPPYHLYYFQR